MQRDAHLMARIMATAGDEPHERPHEQHPRDAAHPVRRRQRAQQREDAIGGLLKQKMERHGLILDEFAIVNFAFSRSFAEAIEAKVKAEQEKLKAERDLQRIEVEAKQKVASARAEADALALQRQQVTRELLELRKVENEREAIRKWDGKLPNVTGGTVPFIQVKPD